MKPKALFIGGTGTISTAITSALAREGEWDRKQIFRLTESRE